MKYLGLILVAVVALMASQVLAMRINEGDIQLLEQSLETRGYGDKLRSFLEKSRKTIREGNATLGIPPLDPFKSENITVKLDEELVKGSIEVSDFNVTELAGYKIDESDVSILSRKMKVGLTWPVINSKGSYNLDIVALNDYKLYGSGTFAVTLKNLSVHSSVWIKVSNGVGIKKMETKISLESLAVSITGLLNDEELSKMISEVISDLAPQLLQDYQKAITDRVNAMVMEAVNGYLEGKSISQIIGMLD